MDMKGRLLRDQILVDDQRFEGWNHSLPPPATIFAFRGIPTGIRTLASRLHQSLPPLCLVARLGAVRCMSFPHFCAAAYIIVSTSTYHAVLYSSYIEHGDLLWYTLRIVCSRSVY